tara:strand:- start:65 stop:1255 length:1191 start_codon:yes stop_codon:yes gene_type:complete
MVCFLLLIFLILQQPTVAQNSRRGLFISATTASEVTALPKYVAAAKAATKSTSPSSSGDTIISSFVLSPISSNKGFAHRALDALLPIIAKNNNSHNNTHNDSIYIGTNWRSNSELHMHDTYCGQLVFNETFAQADADDSARIATEFVARYPNVQFSWYITPENFLNHLAIGCQSSDLWNNTYVNGTTLSKALGQYLNTWTQALNKVKLSKHFLWSPSCPEISYRHNGSNNSMVGVYRKKLLDGLVVLLNEAPLLDTLVIQDAIGKASNVSINGDVHYNVVAKDTLLHAQVAKEAMLLVGRGGGEGMAAARSAVKINMEMFLRAGRRIPASEIVDMVSDPLENARRVEEYLVGGFHLGPSWEIQDWYKQTLIGKNWTSKCRQWTPCIHSKWAPPCCS